MGSDLSEKDMIPAVGIIVSLALLGITNDPRLLVLAFVLAGVSGIAVGWLSREISPALWAAGLASAVVAVFGGMSVVLPGWYQGQI